MSHKVEISDKTYERLKEYCILNHIKMGQYADKLIYDGLMIEMYGNTPFTNYKKPLQEREIVYIKPESSTETEIVLNNDGVVELPTDEKSHTIYDEKTTEEAIENISTQEDIPQQKYIVPVELEHTTQEETLKEVGVPPKVVNKIKKRRLK